MRLQSASVHEGLNLTSILDVIVVNILTEAKLPILKGIATPTTLHLPAPVSLGLALAVVTHVLPNGLHAHFAFFV